MRLADLLLLRGRLPDEVAEAGERARHAQRALADQLLRAVADRAEQALDGQRGQAGVEADPGVAAAGLGHVERAVCDADHLLPAQGVELLAEERIAGETDGARRPHHATLADLGDVGGDARADPPRQLHEAAAADVSGDEQELVTTPARAGVAAPSGRL